MLRIIIKQKKESAQTPPFNDKSHSRSKTWLLVDKHAALLAIFIFLSTPLEP